MSIRKKVSFLISISIFIVLLILLLTNNISFFDNFIYSIIIYFSKYITLKMNNNRVNKFIKKRNIVS